MHRHFLISVLLCFASQAYASDSLTCTGKFNKKGEKHGNWVCRNERRVVRTEAYRNGILRSYIIFNDKGQVVETRDKKGRVRKYNPCGC